MVEIVFVGGCVVGGVGCYFVSVGWDVIGE